jgi:hypothetical protein
VLLYCSDCMLQDTLQHLLSRTLMRPCSSSASGSCLAMSPLLVVMPVAISSTSAATATPEAVVPLKGPPLLPAGTTSLSPSSSCSGHRQHCIEQAHAMFMQKVCHQLTVPTEQDSRCFALHALQL